MMVLFARVMALGLGHLTFLLTIWNGEDIGGTEDLSPACGRITASCNDDNQSRSCRAAVNSCAFGNPWRCSRKLVHIGNPLHLHRTTINFQQGRSACNLPNHPPPSAIINAIFLTCRSPSFYPFSAQP
ncbi:hypothetical protein HYFRA_00008063 [Hymenoscyphus fraxineus]|uniref:Secreted protein n=1 Tax=Hymenoscyphus fraxineus TaxID=746836 RepID=A0A9N9KRC4_9HELO|nr:hypothetical protein HYFRA_00008063 [Hymenoscyphus fraxineus]